MERQLSNLHAHMSAMPSNIINIHNSFHEPWFGLITPQTIPSFNTCAVVPHKSNLHLANSQPEPQFPNAIHHLSDMQLVTLSTISESGKSLFISSRTDRQTGRNHKLEFCGQNYFQLTQKTSLPKSSSAERIPHPKTVPGPRHHGSSGSCSQAAEAIAQHLKQCEHSDEMNDDR